MHLTPSFGSLHSGPAHSSESVIPPVDRWSGANGGMLAYGDLKQVAGTGTTGRHSPSARSASEFPSKRSASELTSKVGAGELVLPRNFLSAAGYLAVNVEPAAAPARADPDSSARSCRQRRKFSDQIAFVPARATQRCSCLAVGTSFSVCPPCPHKSHR